MGSQGQEPFCMDAAADHLKCLADGNTARRPLLEVSRMAAAPGPAVGPGVRGVAPPVGLNLDAAPPLFWWFLSIRGIHKYYGSTLSILNLLGNTQ